MNLFRCQNLLKKKRSSSLSPSRKLRELNWAKYSTRFVALKFAYLGRNYNGFEKQKDRTQLPTVEEVLWRALKKAHLILPEVNSRTEEGEVTWEGCEYSKCGRTDRGVSAFGQVIGIRLRSNRPPEPSPGLSPSAGERRGDDFSGLSSGTAEHVGSGHVETLSQSLLNEDSVPSLQNSQDADRIELCPVDDEIPYVQILNRLLPPDIRILAWCPSPPPGFSARHSCTERRYKYFFTQPAFAPTHGTAGFKHSASGSDDMDPRREGWLDIEAMRDAAKKFEGLHDFQNFCKVDASKQIDTFRRRIFYAGIEELPPDSESAAYINLPGFQERQKQAPNGFPHNPTTTVLTPQSSTPKIYTFTLHGSGFLWHQVRFMVAILFRIGQGLESADLIDTLLDIDQTPERPMYDMAEEAPLVLWDCIFPREGGDPHEDGLDWVYAGENHNTPDSLKLDKDKKRAGKYDPGKYGAGGLVDDLWAVWRGRKIDEILAGRLLDVVASQGNNNSLPPAPLSPSPNNENKQPSSRRTTSRKIFLGGDAARTAGRYVPVLAKPRRARVEVLNARYAARKGFEADTRIREQGFRSLVLGGKGGEEGERKEKEKKGEKKGDVGT